MAQTPDIPAVLRICGKRQPRLHILVTLPYHDYVIPVLERSAIA